MKHTDEILKHLYYNDLLKNDPSTWVDDRESAWKEFQNSDEFEDWKVLQTKYILSLDDTFKEGEELVVAGKKVIEDLLKRILGFTTYVKEVLDEKPLDKEGLAMHTKNLDDEARAMAGQIFSDDIRDDILSFGEPDE